jgi:hypothetical protein
MKLVSIKNGVLAGLICAAMGGLNPAANSQVVQRATPAGYRTHPAFQESDTQQAVPVYQSVGDISSACEEQTVSDCYGRSSCFSGHKRELGDPWTLFGNGCEEPCITIGGWVAGGYYNESNDLFNSDPNRFNNTQSWLFAEKVAESENGELGFGFRFDGMYGTDANDTQSFGNNPDNFDIAPGFTRGGGYGWAIPQLYLEVAKGDFSVKIGHFYTLIGFEVVTAPDNFFFSHAITMYNSEPFTHTGVLASYAASDNTTLYGGWTAGWDTGFDQFDGGSNFLGGISTSLGDYVSMAYMTTIGNFGARGSDGYMQSLVFDVTLTDKLNYVLQSDLLRVGSTGEDTFGINQYLFYTVSDRMKLGTRVEWWKADTQTGYAPHGGTLPASGNLSYYEATSGVNYRLTSNLTMRPEYRYDWSEGADYNQGIFGIDFVLTY